ncbi:MAG: hypothetical protein FI718_01220 [SAR202 cluster bacterium]|mgnify:CR=1 FL=1|nr:hypothetical protein [SAR202 cluster bacterium]|tara:strand:+ start:11592 stop:13193 length:1602 start_codon:yes stop_codon:yes gene_type:complete
MSKEQIARRIIVNDDGWIVSFSNKRIDKNTLETEMLCRYSGSPVDTISWCVGDHEVYDYETQIGEIFGVGQEVTNDEKITIGELTSDHEQALKNFNALKKLYGGPLTGITNEFKNSNIDIFASMRMNSHYAIPFMSPRYGEFRRSRPDLLIGQPDEFIPSPTVRYAIRTGVDYKYPEVREHYFRIIEELVTKFQLSGIELDYMRHPAFFRPEEAKSNAYLMTDFIERVRTLLSRTAKLNGNETQLLVRVPPTLYDSLRIGLDVETWIKEDLVDLVAAGGGFMPFEMPIKEFVEAAKNSKCRIYGSFEALRWALDEEVLYALAMRYWDAGVDGLYFFNYFNTPAKWKQKVMGKMADPVKLKKASKRYELDHYDRVENASAHVGAFRYAIPRAQLPIQLVRTHSNRGVVLKMDIADDLKSAKKNQSLFECILELGITGLKCNEYQKISVSINEKNVIFQSANNSEDGWEHLQFDQAENYHTDMKTVKKCGTLIKFDVTEADLVKGNNQITVNFAQESIRNKPVILEEVRLNIKYH